MLRDPLQTPAPGDRLRTQGGQILRVTAVARTAVPDRIKWLGLKDESQTKVPAVFVSQSEYLGIAEGAEVLEPAPVRRDGFVGCACEQCA